MVKPDTNANAYITNMMLTAVKQFMSTLLKGGPDNIQYSK